MSEINKQAGKYDAVISTQPQTPMYGAVMGGIDGLKNRFDSVEDVSQKARILEEALQYEEEGKQFIIDVLKSENKENLIEEILLKNPPYSELIINIIFEQQPATILKLSPIKIWNEFREKNIKFIPDLSYVNFSGADLSYANLMSANLYDANLMSANLYDANFSYADLRYARLKRSDLTDADLSNANLSGAILNGAYLIRVNLSDANLSSTDLSNVNFSDTDLSGANLKNANLSDAILKNANLKNANLSDTILKNANLKNADLRGANLSDAYSKDAKFDKALIDRKTIISNEYKAKILKEGFFQNTEQP